MIHMSYEVLISLKKISESFRREFKIQKKKQEVTSYFLVKTEKNLRSTSSRSKLQIHILREYGTQTSTFIETSYSCFIPMKILQTETSQSIKPLISAVDYFVFSVS